MSGQICQAATVSANLSSTSVPVASGKIPVLHIAAENLTPLDIGLEIGKQSKILFADIESRYDRYLMDSLSQIGFDDMLSDRLPKLKNSIDSAYQKELEGVASSWSLIHDNKLGDGFLSWDEYWLLNLLPDIGLPANGVGFGVLSQLSSENSTLIGRNLNLKNTAELRSLQAITVYEYKDRAVVNIGFAGIISVVTGFNESGLFVARFNAASGLSYQNSYRVKNKQNAVKAQGFVLRKALEKYTSAQNATRFMAKKEGSISSNILLADKKNIQVLEYSVSGKAIIRRWNSRTHPSKRWDRNSQIAVVDCHVLLAMTNNCKRAKDSYRWDRLRSLATFTSNAKAGVQDIAKIMLDDSNKYYEILTDNTIQSMIYLPTSGYLYLYAAPVSSVNDTMGNTVRHPSYQVYYEDLIPSKLRKARNSHHYFWWVVGLLTLLILALWWIRRSVKRAEVLSEMESYPN
jgi:hypothetical protein